MKQKLLFFFLFSITIFSFSQDGSLDTSFNPSDVGFGFGDGSDEGIYTMAFQNNGKILIGGSFRSYNNSKSSRIARLNTDSTLDSSFNIGTGATDDVNVIAVQNDEKIIVVGNFMSFNGTSANRILRLNTDGTIDTTFNIGTGPNGDIKTVVIQSDGKILLGGSLGSFNGTSCNGIVRLNIDGSVDTNFDLDVNLYNGVNALAVQDDGKIVTGGAFPSNVTGNSFSSITRLNSDGSLDSSFNVGAGVDNNNYVTEVALQSDGKILLGGEITSFNGITTNKLIRLNSDGSLDATFTADLNEYQDEIKSIKVKAGGKILIGGVFYDFSTPNYNGIAQLNFDGSIDTNFKIDTGFFGTNSICVKNDGETIISGTVISDGNIRAYGLAKIDKDGNMDSDFNISTSVNDIVRTLKIQNNGKIVLGGDFIGYKGISSSKIVRLNADGTFDTSFNIGDGANNDVNALEIQADGKIIIGGRFTSFNNVATKEIVRLNADGSLDTSFEIVEELNSDVTALAIQNDGKILVGGLYNPHASGILSKGIVRLNTDGSVDSSFNVGTGIEGGVNSITVQDDGKIILNGISSYNGTFFPGLVRLNTDGSIDTSFNLDSGISGNFVSNPIVKNDGKIIIAKYVNSTTGNIIQLNSNGSVDTSFNSNLDFEGGRINRLLLQNDGKLVAGGWFNSFGGATHNGIIRLNSDGSLDTSFNSGTGILSNDNPGNIYTMQLHVDGSILIGGDFTSYNGIGRNRIARINASSALSILDQSKEIRVFFYPNPTQNVLHVGVKQGIEANQINIYNTQGENVLSSKNLNIDISKLPSSIYFVEVETNKGKSTKKIIKN